MTVVQTTFANVAALGTQFQNDPAPILQQILTNQLANAATLATAFEGVAGGFASQASALPAATLLAAQQLAAGQFSSAVGTLFQAGIGLILAPAISLIGATSVITDMAQRFANVVAAVPNVLLPIGIGVISPVASAVYSFGDAGQAVIDAARAGHVAGALNALVNIPAIVTNAFLNGYAPQFTPGVFSPLADGGLVAVLLNARDAIAQALGATAPATANAVTADAVTALPTGSNLVSLAATTTADVTAATESTTGTTTTESATSTTKTVGGSDSEAAAPSSSTKPATKPAGTKPSSSTASEASESSTGVSTASTSGATKAAATSAGSSTANKTAESKS